MFIVVGGAAVAVLLPDGEDPDDENAYLEVRGVVGSRWSSIGASSDRLAQLIDLVSSTTE